MATKHHSWDTGQDGNKYGSRRKKRELIPRYCEYCGWTFLVTKHRIKPGCEGGKYIPGNVVGLCPNHHAMADRGAFDRGMLFGIVHARLRARHGRQTDSPEQ